MVTAVVAEVAGLAEGGEVAGGDILRRGIVNMGDGVNGGDKLCQMAA